jgi:DNA-directed RNA polymerase sigma subunit (sigma70/sigma32)
MMIKDSAKDPLLEHWSSWKKSGSEKDLGRIFTGLTPTLATHTRKFINSGLPPTSLDIEAKRITVDALNKYNPQKGVLIKTFVSSKLPGLKRFVDTYQKIGRIPEYQTQSAATMVKVTDSLTQSLDRPPSIQELSEELGWPEPQVLKTMQYVRRDLPESGFEMSMPIFETPWQDKALEKFHFIYKSSTPQEQVAMESFLGLHGKEAVSERRAAEISKLSLSNVRKLKKALQKQMSGIKWEPN